MIQQEEHEVTCPEIGTQDPREVAELLNNRRPSYRNGINDFLCLVGSDVMVDSNEFRKDPGEDRDDEVGVLDIGIDPVREMSSIAVVSNVVDNS